ncbi:MAG: hypothetical protein PHX34_00250 [Candidatus Shapirobacteria bacterium]|nr:hypothetical protein [Candidatus Shapirobacteria bacterium]
MIKYGMKKENLSSQDINKKIFSKGGINQTLHHASQTYGLNLKAALAMADLVNYSKQLTTPNRVGISIEEHRIGLGLNPKELEEIFNIKYSEGEEDTVETRMEDFLARRIFI